MRVLILNLTAAALAACLTSASAQDDYDEDFPPGLLARYTAGDETIERVDPDVAFLWGDHAPDSRLRAGAFSATWESLLLVRQPGEYRFHAWVCGAAVVEIDGARVLDGTRETPGWIDGDPVTLGFGEQPLKVSYRAPAAIGDSGDRAAETTGGGAQIRLFWSSESFPLEPVPAHLLYRDGGNAELHQIERGRVLFDAHRCGRCHVRENAPEAPAAPALVHLASGTSHEWILEKVEGTGAAASSGKMPQFGFTPDEAAAVTAFLSENARDVKLADPGKSKDAADDRRQGEVLFRSLGCLACHTVTEDSRRIGTDGLHGGGDLTAVGAKRSAEWLATWLADPERLNADHRMPVFDLSSAERRQLALYLASLGGQADSAAKTEPAHQRPDAAQVRAGRELVQQARCAACHEIPGVKPAEAAVGIPDLSRPVGDWQKSCIGDSANRTGRRPSYAHLSAEDVAALQAWITASAGPLSVASRFDQGRRVLEQRNCLACHERDTSKGIAGLAARVSDRDETLRGQSQGLIPPALTAVGDKFVDEALARAVSGDQQERRLPWLFVRMPKFGHAADEKAALVEYLIGHDRIPEHPGLGPAARRTDLQSVRGHESASNGDADGLKDRPTGASTEAAGSTDDELLVAGHTLVGAKGFSCVACHHVGEFAPRNVALGTRGSDLLAIGQHMRESFFIRWTRSPMRIVPGMEMPSFVKPVPEVLDGSIDAQLRAIWKALNDPRFTVPTDPSSVEQYFVVRPGEPPRIVRDVFTNPEENGGGYVPRALAVGFPNGHSVLYDLDTFAVRGWYFGDFARQRTFGKSWYWDMAGVPVMTGFERQSDFSLRRIASGNGSHAGSDDQSGWIAPKMSEGTSGRLLGYAAVENAIRTEYELNFEADGQPLRVRIVETSQADVGDGQRSGWERRIAAAHVPPGYELAVSIPDRRNGLGQPQVQAFDAEGELIRQDRAVLRAGGSGTQQPEVVLRYDAGIPLPAGEIPPRPALPPPGGAVTTVPGFDGVRLPLDPGIMPTSICWTADGTLAFTSLKGHVYLARDTDGDGVEDSLSVFEEGLAAPYGLMADGEDLLVAHKPEVLRLKDTDGDGRADVREVVATGWGYNDNYHDWTTGFARDASGNLYVGTGSDYAQPKRPQENARWRGKVLKVAPDGTVTPIAHGFRYPMGLAMNAAGDLFATDNQGVQNTFNEINHIIPGGHYGVPGRWESDEGVTHLPPAIQVPHPWSRSVNGIAFLPVGRHGASVEHREAEHRTSNNQHPTSNDGAAVRSPNRQPSTLNSQPTRPELADHGIGTEYDSRFLVRFTFQKVGDAYQGAAYYFSRPDAGAGGDNFSGPLTVAVAPNGDLYIGSIHDSGWLGGLNTGEIVRLRPNGKLPNGIRELRATTDGFEIEFFGPVEREAAARPESYTISGYTRVWGGAYATPDTGRHKLDVESVQISEDSRTVHLAVPDRQTGHVYEVTCGSIGTPDQRDLWPATGHYTLHRIPAADR